MFAPVVEYYQTPLYNLALRMTGDAAVSEELVQDSFLRAFAALASFDNARPFFPWLYTIALNRIRSHLAKASTQAPSSDTTESLVSGHDAPDTALLKQERDILLDRALRSLPPKLREPLALRYYQDLSFTHVAEILHISENAAKKRVYKALRSIRALLPSNFFPGQES